MTRTYRIGQIVPSSNVTMETEIPALLRARETVLPERFTFHSARMRMTRVTAEELAAMDAESDRCAVELSDARVDVLGYACLVAIMSAGPGYHRNAQQRLHGRTADNGAPAPVVTSAVVLSACVQMPSLDVLDEVQDALGKPVLSAAVATTHRMLRALGLPAEAPRGGALLGGAYALADPAEAVVA
ncbi:maleate cis-trans isomerase family protein [Pseudonocardia asaccharolytica]|uniref:Asp/Glu racemase n=1 Tax=Pseudonocardia asaccharolytica DSM 44247 = NBRC 16224 TaxID=1123024 RepID=A0A511CW29_9PSEU|nr:hypothetical protein [Pseudonocardia asaccharolytica]GEL16772.1 hypothetical protein PA7_06090 [Pseudonocardia asaccharolytica DSM 44247 = NBRC 16224]